MPRRARQPQQTRADILTAAVKLFAGSAWAGTTLAAIATVAITSLTGRFSRRTAVITSRAFDTGDHDDGRVSYVLRHPSPMSCNQTLPGAPS